MSDQTEGTHAPTPPQRRLEYMAIVELKRAKRNPKDHDIGALDASVKRFGFVDPVVIDERTGRLVSGHGRVELLTTLEAKKSKPPPGVEVVDGEWRIPVVRGWASKSDSEAEGFILAANRTTELGGWQQDKLAEVLEDLAKAGELQGTGYTGDDLDTLLEQLGETPRHYGTSPAPASTTTTEPPPVGEAPPAADPVSTDPLDEEPPVSERPWVKDGDLFELGGHRLLVGDSFKAEDMRRLLASAKVKAVGGVVTDPPYAIYGSATGVASDIADDKMVRPFFEKLFNTCADLLPWFAHAYYFCDWRTWPAIWESAKRAGLSPKNQIVWDKGGSGLGSNWANTYELIAYLAKIPPQKAMKSSNKITGQRPVFRPNILRYPRTTGEEREHNAAKPVKLCAELVTAAVDEGGVILEPFGGGGATLIACEITKRRCLAMEIEPKFAQVIVERWQRVTGNTAVKL